MNLFRFVMRCSRCALCFAYKFICIFNAELRNKTAPQIWQIAALGRNNGSVQNIWCNPFVATTTAATKPIPTAIQVKRRLIDFRRQQNGIHGNFFAATKRTVFFSRFLLLRWNESWSSRSFPFSFECNHNQTVSVLCWTERNMHFYLPFGNYSSFITVRTVS